MLQLLGQQKAEELKELIINADDPVGTFVKELDTFESNKRIKMACFKTILIDSQSFPFKNMYNIFSRLQH